jgi:hypothetical protein
MSATVAAACPTCGKKFQVPATLAGRTIKCKECATAFKVPGGAAPVTAARPVAARPAPPAAPIPFQDDPPKPPVHDDDEGGGGKAAKAYGLVKDDSDIPRCPFCAKELDPPDTRICLNCGYNLLERKRHESKKVYALTTGDYVKHLLPGVLMAIVGGLLIAGMVVCWLNMGDWLQDSFLDSGEKNEITQKTKYYVPPFCFNVWITVFAVFGAWKSFKFAFLRLFIHWKPPETVKKE